MLVQKANVVFEISEDTKEEYLSKGYDVVDEFGNIIIKAVPTDIGELRKMYKIHIEKIETLKKEIDALKKVKSETKKTTKK